MTLTVTAEVGGTEIGEAILDDEITLSEILFGLSTCMPTDVDRVSNIIASFGEELHDEIGDQSAWVQRITASLVRELFVQLGRPGDAAPGEAIDLEELGKAIYAEALSGRRGFRDDQLGIEDEEIWKEIHLAIGKAAVRMPQ